MTSAQAAPASMRVTSSGRGMANWCVMTSLLTRLASKKGMVEIGCMAHARRKFFDLHVANKSQFTEQALHSIGGLYEVELLARDMSDEDRWRISA